MLIDALTEKPNTLKIVDSIWLKEGECANIYGDSDQGKTLTCFNIVKNNSDKICLYIAAETLDANYIALLNSLAPHVYLGNSTKLANIIKQVSVIPVGFIIIDSVTALQYIEDKKIIEEFFKVIEEKKINAILVSQMREYNNKEYFENDKILNFYSYRIKVEKNNDDIVLNNNTKINIYDILNQKKGGKENGN